jgi:DNA-binding response OmpR family regulator
MTAPSVLVVEDDDDIRASLLEFLDDHGYLARGAANGREGLTALSDGARPAVIILDLMMPVMDGWAFRAELHRLPAFSGVPIVVISAYDRLERRVEGLDLAGWLAKPIDLDALLDVVRVHCGTQR